MTNPRLVAIDEPSLGLAPNITDQVYERLRDGLLAGGMLREIEVTAAMPKVRPWLISQRK